MPINTMTNFNRMVLNSIILAVRRSETGELHGSWPAIAEHVVFELNGPAEDDDIDRMQAHLIAVGLDYLTANSPVVFFRSMTGELNLVSRELVKDA